MPRLHPPARRWTRPTARLVGSLAVVAVVASLVSCTSDGDDAPEPVPTSRGALGAVALAVAQDAGTDGELSAIELTSTDGSVGEGTITTFTVTNTTTDEVISVPVGGVDGGTSTRVAVEPGTYRVEPGAPAVLDLGVQTVAGMEPSDGLITVPEPTDGQPQQVVPLSFSVDFQPAAIQMATTEVGIGSVGLVWSARDDITGFQVRRTGGTAPAADPTAGDPVELADAAATQVTATGLAPSTPYTFTVFGLGADGAVVSFASASATTASASGDEPAYALAPNTIVPTSLAALEPVRVADDKVQVTLAPKNADRASTTPMPGVEEEVQDGGCVVGSPFLVSYDVAKDDGFFGLVESCEAGEGGAATAVVDTDVPLSSVLSYLDVDFQGGAACVIFADDGTITDTVTPQECDATDTDGDGLPDAQEESIGTDPASADTDGDEVPDGVEVNQRSTDPLNRDSDFDRLDDDELTVFGTDPASADTDGDGCWDYGETSIGRDPLDDADADSECYNPFPQPWQASIDQARQAADDAEVDASTAGAAVVQPAAFSARSDVAAQPALDTATRTLGGDEIALAASPDTINIDDQTCKPSGTTSVGLKPTLTRFANVKVTLRKEFAEHSWGRLNTKTHVPWQVQWDFNVGATLSIDPEVRVTAGYHCSLALIRVKVQVTLAPVPLVVTLDPKVEIGSTGSLVVSGPELDATVGVKSAGTLTQVEKFGPDGVDYQTTGSGLETPLEIGKATVSAQGALSLDWGLASSIGIGFDGKWAGAEVGFGLPLDPLNATLTGDTTDPTCAKVNLGGGWGANVYAEAWFLTRWIGLRKEYLIAGGTTTWGNRSIGSCQPPETPPTASPTATGASSSPAAP